MRCLLVLFVKFTAHLFRSRLLSKSKAKPVYLLYRYMTAYSSLRRSGIGRVNEGSHSFTWNEPYACLHSRRASPHLAGTYFPCGWG